jgi:hypothetical protein
MEDLIFMRKQFVVPAALLFAASLPLHLGASTFDFSFAAPGASGAITLTYGTATDAKYSQAFEVTGISGTFSDSNNGLSIVNTPILGLIAIKHDSPEPTNLLAPNDFSRFAVATGLSPQSNGFLTYDNLYWPGGSPQTASDYPPHGGFVDIYGLMFDIGGGRVVDFWSNGDTGTGVDYGVAVATSAMALDYVAGGGTITPEPSGLALIGIGLVGILIWRRRAARSY